MKNADRDHKNLEEHFESRINPKLRKNTEIVCVSKTILTGQSN